MTPHHAGERVAVRFFMPSAALAPYVTTYYLTDVAVPGGESVDDYLHPEWANIRLSKGVRIQAASGAEPLGDVPEVAVAGPSSRALRFVSGPGQIWGIGLIPLGWARLFDAPACDHADRFCDGQTDPAFAALGGLHAAVFDAGGDGAAQAARIDVFMLDLLRSRPHHPEEDRIRTAHAALVDPAIASVAQLAARIGMSSRSLERLSLRVFGFPPKLLLRRQRFLRSLAQFMIDPSLTWIATLDWQYVDQAHFVRDFKRFMGMSPSAYAALDHPVLRAAAQARLAAAGAAVQVLHRPR